MQNIPINVLQGIVDKNSDMIVVFYKDELVLINSAFKKFFSTTSLENYKREFGAFVHHFVPHPSYFHAEKIIGDKKWYEAILELEPNDRIISMVTPFYEPHAFLVDVNSVVDDFVVVGFKDITQDLIKRIMIENSTNLDIQSTAYTKKYFLQIAKSYEDAAKFNKKIIALARIELSQDSDLQEVVKNIKHIIRQDDMLCRWDRDIFFLFYMVDNESISSVMERKLKSILSFATITIFVEENKDGVKNIIKKAEN